MAKGVKTGGRQKGTQNKTTQTAKEAISLAAEMLGGVGRLVEWVKEDAANEKAFWSQVYPKLLPLQVNGDMSVSGAFDVRNIVVNGVKANG